MTRVYYRNSSGFTIVELLVVIVVIGILAAITIVVYIGISQKAIVATLQSDLTNSSEQLKMYQVTNSAYPTSLDGNNCPVPADASGCLKASPGTTYAYRSNNTTNPQTFALTATKSGTSYIIADNTTPAVISANPTLNCPPGFIPVPGSITYGMADFCTMKYEAKNISGVATSQAAGTPWVSISQTSAITTAAAACTGCHLITEAEWLTIAQNVLNNPTNWSSGTVGSGYIYSGHNDDSPSVALVADTSDSNGYANTGNSSLSGANQKRTLTLSNGQVVWDLAGNVWEWTSGTSTTGQPGVTGAGYNWREWTAITNPGTLSPNPSPASTGISGASTWTSGNGIGMISSYASETVLHGLLRGGMWDDVSLAGVLEMWLSWAPGDASNYIGFRMAK